LKRHPDRSPLHHLIQTVSNKFYLQGFATTTLLSVGGFMLMPFMSAFIVHNVGLPVVRLPLVYVLVGLFSVVAGPLIGRASDRFGKFNVFSFGCASPSSWSSFSRTSPSPRCGSSSAYW
jgi:predicted MFS family arabinose efflux permease